MFAQMAHQTDNNNLGGYFVRQTMIIGGFYATILKKSVLATVFAWRKMSMDAGNFQMLDQFIM